MPNYYCSDADVTDRISTDLTGSELDTSTKRADKCRLPATARIDALTSAIGPFGDSADSGFNTVINVAGTAYAVAMAMRILTNNPNDGQAKAWEDLGDKVMMIDKATGRSNLVLSSTTLVGTPDIKRDRDDEDDDEQSVVM